MQCLNTTSTEEISEKLIINTNHQSIDPSDSDKNQQSLPSQPSSTSSDSPTTNTANGLCISSDLPTTPPTPQQQSSHNSQISEFTDQLEQLSSKLVRSIERIASLEDELHESRRKNEKLASRNAKLELEATQHKQALEGGLLVERENVQLELQKLTQRVVLESERRSKSEASLSTINQELDDLSASLFTEANRLVATEKLARIQAERKMREVEEAMMRVEEVIEARRDQSNDLRLSLEAAERERDHYKSEYEHLRDQLDHPSDQIIPHSLIDSSTKLSSHVSILNSGESIGTPLLNVLPSSNHDHSHTSFTPSSPIPGYHSPAFGFPATTQLKLSHETLPFTEFLQFLQHLRQTRKDLLTRPSQPPTLTDSYYSAAIVMTSIGINSHPSNQVIQSSTKEATLPPCSKELLTSVLPLSQHLSQPFIKRCLDEDSDPALRLDLAPGLNFISRRPIVHALLEGNLVIEPVWSESDRPMESDKCTLCGCSLSPWLSTRGQSAVASNQPDASTNPSSARSTMRKMLRGGSWGFGGIGKPKRSSNPNPLTRQAEKVNTPVSLMRTHSGPVTRNNNQGEPLYIHTFRTTDAAATRYLICPTYCLARLRSVCHFWTFVRSLERGVLLDESFWFSHYINLPPASSRFSEVQSLGLAYDSTLKSIRQKSLSTDSLLDSLSSTHFDPSSASTSAHTHQSQNPVDSPSTSAHTHQSQNPVDLTSTVPSETQGSVHVAEQPSSSSNLPDHHTRIQPLCQTSDDPNIGLEQTRHVDETCDSQMSPLPSPTSTSGHDVDMVHETVQRHAVTISSPTPSPQPRRRSLVCSLSPSMAFTHQKVPCEADIETSGGPSSAKATYERPPDLNIPVVTSSLSAPVTSTEIGQHNGSQSRDKAQSGIDLLETGWEEKCWQQVVKLKEEMFLKRVGVDIITN